MTKVAVIKKGKKYIVQLGRSRVTLEKVAEKCNIGAQQLRRALDSGDGANIIHDWLLKAENNVYASSKTHWKNGEPMWVTKVAVITGVSNASATVRLKQWMKTGDTEKLLLPKLLLNCPGPEAVRVPRAPELKVRKKHGSRKVVPKYIAPYPVIPSALYRESNKIMVADRDCSVTDDDEFAGLSHLSGNADNGNERLRVLKGPSKYELENL